MSSEAGDSPVVVAPRPRGRRAEPGPPALLARVRVRNFRSVRDVAWSPRGVCALVGEASTGKSTLLAAVWALLDPAGAPLQAEDARDATPIRIDGRFAGGGRVSVSFAGRRSPRPRQNRPPVLFLPASERTTTVVAGSGRSSPQGQIFERSLATAAGASSALIALSLVGALETCSAAAVQNLVLLVEEPELYLRPQAQRYLYRLLRAFALQGNQVLYSTHSPAFLNAGRLEELALVTNDSAGGTQVFQPKPLAANDEFRVVSEFDAERSELFLARAAILVEGRTEKLAFPLLLRSLGHDGDREAITIVDCGGKANMPLFARICHATGVPFVAVHDRDAAPGAEPEPAHRVLNALIARVAGSERTVMLEPDFEGVAGLRWRGHKPQHAWKRFSDLTRAELPEPLVRAAELALSLARD